MSQITFQQGVASYAGTQDTMLRTAAAGTNYGAATTMTVDAADNSSSHQAQALLRFDDIFGTGAGQIPLGATITSATLTLQTSGSGDGAKLHRMLSSWSEASTWSSMGNGIKSDGVEAVAVADSVTGTVKAGSGTFDVTKSLQAWSDGADNNGWAFLPTGNDGWDFHSSESAYKPLLKVSYTLPDATPLPAPDPDPTSPSPTPTPTDPDERPTTGWRAIHDEPQFTGGGYANGPAAQWHEVHSAFTDDAIQVSPSGDIYRFGSRYGERRENDSSSVDRTELKHPIKYAPGTDIWISYNFLVEEKKPGEPDWTYAGTDNSGANFGQLHGGSGSPIVTWQLKDEDTFELWTRPQQADTSSSSSGKVVRYHTDQFKRGEDYNIVMHIKSAPSGKGSVLDVWMDGKQIVDLADIPLGYSNSTENYFKWGIYRQTNEIPLNAQYANMEIGTVDLSHRITNPLPVDFYI